MQAKVDDYKDLKLKLDGLVPPGHGFHRNLLLDTLYASLPRDPQVKVQIYNAEIVPGGYTNWHCHNGAAFFVALQGAVRGAFPGRRAGQGQGRRLLLRADRQIPSRAQSAPGIALSLRRPVLHLARPRARDQFGGAAVVNSALCTSCRWNAT